MTKTLALSAAAALLFCSTAANAQPPFVFGWNYVTPTNCAFVPATPAIPASVGPPAVPATPATPDELIIVVDVGPPLVSSTPAVPPPQRPTGQFSTDDPVAIGLAAPFCKDGTAFYVYWDGTKMAYFSVYPNLGQAQ